MKNITTIIDKINADPSVMEIGKEGLALINQLLDIAEADVEADDCSQALEVIERIIRANQSEKTIIQMFSLRLTGVGLSAYSAKEYRVAEIAFKLLAEADDLIGKNNYAYMIRRHETSDAFEEDHVKVIQLLQEGVQQGDAFSLVNAALVFGLMMGGDKGWQVADSTFERLSTTDGQIVSNWWEKLAQQGDYEGYLVIFFLLKHRIIDHSDLGSIQEIAKYLSKDMNGLPEWLIKDYSIETVDETIHPFLKDSKAQSGIQHKREGNTSFKRYDVITFDESDKVVVLAALVYEGNEYVFVNEILPDESDATDVYKIMVAHYEDGTLEKVVDPVLLQVLSPKFAEILGQYA